MSDIVRNSIVCLRCGEEIVSEHRHDFRRCKCGAVAVDGGQMWARRLGNFGDWIDTSILAEPPSSKEELLEGVAMLRWIKSGSRPPDESWSTSPLLDDWRIVPARRPPAAVDMSELEGTVTGHPDFRDGQRIRTTPLIFAEHGKGWARTITRFWRLGTPSAETLQ